MKAFMDADFLLTTETARTLFHDHARQMPIYDYHCHLNAEEIYRNIQYDNIGHLMLGGDHYKWRAMLSNGVDESLIYGDAPDYDKFLAYAAMLKYAIGNPLYHWTHLELKRVFGIEDVLNEVNAPSIWERANALLKTDAFRCRRIIEKFDVRLICTTDDPVDDLKYHRLLAEDAAFRVKVLPTFRPDNALSIEKATFPAYIKSLSTAAGVEIQTPGDVVRALERRLDFFAQAGAKISDHGMNEVVCVWADEAELTAAFKRVMRGEPVESRLMDAYKTYLITELGQMYTRRGFTMQLHMNAMRNNNAAKFGKYGPDTGFDSVRDAPIAVPLSRLLDGIESRGGLPRTILYSLNPSDNFVIGTMLGNFQGGMPGKVQMGSGWWFQDQRDGMVDQLKALANLGLLGRFVGMLTDSRSFVSFTRHEYFRRILCDVIGGWVENGEYPADMDVLGALVRGICYDNAVAYFGIDL